MKRLRHGYSFAAGIAAGLVAADHAWLVFLAGAAVTLLVLFAGRLTLRLARRVDRAIPDSDRAASGQLVPLHQDDDYLAGVELGIRSARRTVGRQDGRRSELDVLGFGAAQTEDIPF